MKNKPVFLMTKADAFEVSYAINPWMHPEAWRKDAARLKRQAKAASAALGSALKRAGARVIWLDGAAGLPDMVFPANAAIVLDRRALLARFAYPERRGEEAHFEQAFANLKARGILTGYERFPAGVLQEGAGDCIWDGARQCFWAGYGPRSSVTALRHIEHYFDMPVHGLELVTDRFYHLDTCFLVLEGGEVLYYPPALSEAAERRIMDLVPRHDIIVASEEDAAAFSINAVNIGRRVIMAAPPARLAARLGERGYQVEGLDLSAFMMSGGAAYCMTLRLDRASAAAGAMAKTGT